MSKQVLIQPLPGGTLGSYALAGISGALNFTLATNDLLFAFQWTDSTRQAVIQHVSIWVAVASTITTAVATGIDMCTFYDYFNRHTGGIALSSDLSTNSEGKLNSQMPASLVTDIRIASTIPLELPLVPGAMNNTAIANVTFGTGTVVGTTPVPRSIIYERTTNDYPLTLHAFEGFGLRMSANGPATGQLRLGVAIKWIEQTKQTF